MKYRESKAIEEAKLGLAKFRDKNPFPVGYGTKIYDQLENDFEINIARSQMVRWLPESDGFCSMTIIDQDGNICEFEVDIANPENSSVDKFKIVDFVKSNQYKKLKPWDDLKVAIDIYIAESGANWNGGEK